MALYRRLIRGFPRGPGKECKYAIIHEGKKQRGETRRPPGYPAAF